MSKNSLGIHIGIDLGTTNTVIASCKGVSRGFNRSKVLDIEQIQYVNHKGVSKSLPSVLFFENDGNVIVGEYAKGRKNSGLLRNILYNTKIDMGTKVIYENGNGFTPVKAASEILKVCKKNINRYINVKTEEFPTVTITVPASYNQNQIADTLAAAKLAGFDEDKIEILEEPVAALFHYLNERLIYGGEDDEIDFSSPKRILIYDIGGGTCDVCIVDLKINGQYDYDINFIATNRYTEFGGNDFDEQAAIGLINKLFKKYNIKEKDIDSSSTKNQLVGRIIAFCELYKLNFSEQLANGVDENDIQTEYGAFPDFLTLKNVDMEISYKEYKQFTSVFFEDNYTHPTRNLQDKMKDKNIIKPVYQLQTLLKKKNERSFDCIFLTGGMSKYLPIEDALREYCNVPIIKTDEPMDSVARGASLSRFIKTNTKKSSFFTNNNSQEDLNQDDTKTDDSDKYINTISRPKLAESIFIDINNSLPMKIIDADVDIPCKGKVDHIFQVGASGVTFNLFAGLSEWDPEMRILYDYSKEFDHLVKPNTKATIDYEIDDNRFLKLRLNLMDYRKQQYDLNVDTTY